MLFNSIQFMFFFPVVVFVFMLSKQKFRWIVLLSASYMFYMAWNPLYITLIFASTVIDYYSAVKIEQSKLGKKRFLFLSIATNLGILFIFKYYNFFIDSFFRLIPFLESPTMKLLLPVGISFYTFQTMSYTIDVYRGDIKAEKHFGYFALFVSFFPQLVAGPIERSTRLLPQLKSDFKFDYRKISDGLKLMGWGLFKKVVIADRLATFVDPVFNDPEGWTGISYVIATLFFAIQIYCDFSGYSDIAIGAAKFFGVDLMENFRRPYHSKSVTEFWQRWHISLSTWFRDYVYIPLGGNRRSELRTVTNLFLTFLISGLWHGANWTFILWGCLNGFYLIVERLWAKRVRGVHKSASDKRFVWIKSVFQMTTTFILISFSWIFFRANSLSDAFYIISNLHTGWTEFITNVSNVPYIKSTLAMGQRKDEFVIAIIALIILEIVHIFQRRNGIRLTLASKPFLIRWALSILLVLMILTMGFFDKNQFLYFQF